MLFTNNSTTKQLTMESTESKSNPVPNISIPGFSRLFEHSYGWKMKCFWIIVISTCVSMCFYQIIDRVSHYLQAPVTIDVDIKRQQTVQFPASTICPGHLHEILRGRSVGNVSNEEIVANFESMSAEEIWHANRILEKDISASVPCWSSTSDDECDDDMLVDYQMTKENINTIWGKCVILNPTLPLEYRGPFTRIVIKLKQNPLLKLHNISTGDVKRNRLTFFLHTPEAPIRHDAFFFADFVTISHHYIVKFAVKEFEFQNRKSNPCNPSEIGATFCRNDCIDNLLEKELTCKLPFMNVSNLQDCKNWTETKSAYNHTLQMYSDLQVNDCQCTRLCKEKVYSSLLDDKGVSENKDTVIAIYYSENLHEVIIEKYVYSLSALVSDIGGNLGLFLGACVLTLMEVIETIIKQLWSLQHSGRKIFTPSANVPR